MHVADANVLISTSALQKRIAALAEEISRTYSPSSANITIVTVLSGSIIFLADLIRCLPMKMRIGLVTVSSYPGPSTTSRGAVIESAMVPELRDHDVLIVDDILDTGGTLRVVQEEIRQAKPKSQRTAVLLRKPSKAPADVAVDFVGFDVDDVFVIGYGLDFDGYYRNLPYIAVLDSSGGDAECVS